MSDPQAVNDGNRRARLNAMAEGGTAGVEAYDAAQAASQQAAAQARTDTINSLAWAPHNQMAAQAFGQQVSDRVAPQLRDASLARSLAGEQVGYDQSAYGSYMRIGEEGLAARRAAMEHQRRMDSYSQRLADAEHQERLRSYATGGGSGGGGFAGTGMGKEELSAFFQGAGQIKQQQEASAAQRSASIQARHARLLERAAGILDRGTKDGDEQKRDMHTAGLLERLGWKNTATKMRDDTQDAARKRQAARNVVERAAPIAADHRGQAEDRVVDQRMAMADSARYAREAALAAGLPAEFAFGLFPDDRGDVMDALQEHDAYENYLRTGYEDPADATAAQIDAYDQQWDMAALGTAQEYGLSVDRVNEVADQFDLSSPVMVPEQLSKLAEQQQALVTASSQEDDDGVVPTPNEVVARWLAEGAITEAEARYWLRQFGSEEAGWVLAEQGDDILSQSARGDD